MGGGQWPRKFKRGGGLTFPCEKWKIQRGGGVLFEIPSMVGVWIFSGTTHCVIKGVETGEIGIMKRLKLIMCSLIT